MKIYLYLWPLRKKVQFCPTMKKTLKIQCTFLPHLLFWYCSNLPHGLHHFFISVQPHSIGRATDFFFWLFEKSCFFHVIFWVIWVLKHILNNFFFYDFQKVTLFLLLSRVQRSGAEHLKKTMNSIRQIWTMEILKKSIKTVFLSHF